MGKVTALKVQKRSPGRVNVYLDGQFAFGLSRIVAAWLHVGMELNDAKISSLQTQDASEVGYQQALRFLSYRPRSENEVRDRLAEKGADDQTVETVIERLRNAQLLGDEQFARQWIENRSTFRPRSHRMLRYELNQKGIKEEFIYQALAEAEDETELAYQAGSAYSRRLADQDWEEFRKRLTGYLSRRGFSYGTIAPIVRRVWQEVHPAEH